MKRVSPPFLAQMERIHQVTGTRTQMELANVLGIRQSSVAQVKGREKIPAEWLITLLRLYHVHPDWVLTGKHIDEAETQAVSFESFMRNRAQQLLQDTSTELLMEELTRRLAIAEALRIHSK